MKTLKVILIALITVFAFGNAEAQDHNTHKVVVVKKRVVHHRHHYKRPVVVVKHRH